MCQFGRQKIHESLLNSSNVSTSFSKNKCIKLSLAVEIPKHYTIMGRSYSLIVSLLALIASPVFGFTPVKPKATTTALYQKKASWPEYKHDYVDPLTPHQVESKIHTHIDPQKRAVSNEYWLRQLEDEKQKLHAMQSNDTVVESHATNKKPSESFSHYKQANIDPITPHEKPSPVASHMDPIKRQNADKFWRAKYIDDKEKLRKKQAASP